jgi:hypothetical protein
MLRNIRKGLRQLAVINDEFDKCFGTALTGTKANPDLLVVTLTV